MKMKKLRELKRNPPYKHTCSCLPKGEVEYLMELPEYSTCVNPKYFIRKDNEWVEVVVPKEHCV